MVLGDKYIQISPGQSKVYLQDGDSVKGKALILWKKPCKNAPEINGWHRKMLQSINNIIGDPATQNALKHSLQSTAVMAA